MTTTALIPTVSNGSATTGSAGHAQAARFRTVLLLLLAVFSVQTNAADADDADSAKAAAAATEQAAVPAQSGQAAAPEAASESPRVRLSTSAGDIDIELFAARAPASVANFLSLVDGGFYENLVFHRVVANFVIQGGGYDKQLTYRKPPRTVVNESGNGLNNLKGTLSMARMADPDSADSQFFINLRDNPHLDATPQRPGYAVFGKVTAGWEVVEAIELVDTHIAAGMPGVPEEPIVIVTAKRL